jgi:hypothetical protein
MKKMWFCDAKELEYIKSNSTVEQLTELKKALIESLRD